MDLYLEALILFGGIIGNLLMFAVFFQRRLVNSTDVLIRVLSSTDFLLLSVCLMTHWINYNFNTSGKHLALCKTVLFLSLFLFDLEAWTMVCLTIDRCICVIRPTKAKILCTPRNSAYALLVILIITASKNWYVIVI